MPDPPPAVEAELLALVELGLKSGQLWFSYTWDLTNSLERQWRGEKARGGRGMVGLAEMADDRFFWNKALMRRLMEAGNGGMAMAMGGDVPGEVRCRGHG